MLKVFEKEEFGSVRVLRDEAGEPLFVAKDVALALEYPESSVNQVNNLMRLVPEEWKGHNRIMTPGGWQNMLTLTEQGLYFFLGRSDKPKALPFQKWLAGEVPPPSIFVRGNRTTRPSKPPLTGNYFDEGIELLERIPFSSRTRDTEGEDVPA